VKTLIDADLEPYALMVMQWRWDASEAMFEQLGRLMNSRDEEIRHAARDHWDLMQSMRDQGEKLI
jgi:hypothetical protein